MRIFVIGVCFYMAMLLCNLVSVAEAAVNPPTIEECRSDMECDIAARILCEAGHLEWCIEEA